MKDLNNNLIDRAAFFKKISPGIAGEMSKALQKLTMEKIKVEFSQVQSFEQSTVSVDVGEKCFGSYVNFRTPEDNLEGIVVAVFPLSSTKTLIELLFKRYLGKRDKETIDDKMKLSAFKEADNILLSTYIKGVANALKVKLETGVPKFVCFRNVKFIRPTLLKSYSNLESLASVGQFKITEGTRFQLLKGALLLFFSRSSKGE